MRTGVLTAVDRLLLAGHGEIKVSCKTRPKHQSRRVMLKAALSDVFNLKTPDVELVRARYEQ